jgi:membrane protease YdiL (CAAX protease family)
LGTISRRALVDSATRNVGTGKSSIMKEVGLEKSADAPLTYFILIFVLSIPFWTFSAATDRELMPGLPPASLMVVCPALAALLIRLRRFGRESAIALLARMFDIRRLQFPSAVVLLLLINPLLFATSLAIQQSLGVEAPLPSIQPFRVLALFCVFLVAAVCEELGWSGYALDPLQSRWGEALAGLTIGLVWALWHFAPLAQAGRSTEWIAWWSLWTSAARVIMVWLYNRTGRSVFGISLYHAASNVCWQIYPVRGSYFDPTVSALVTVAFAAILIRPWRFKRRKS